MKRPGLLFIPLLFSGFLLGAQEDLSPEAPELILPTILLEIQEEDVTLMEAPLPSESDASFSALELPLPEPEDLQVADITIDAPPGLDQPGRTGAGQPASTFFGEGLIGAGSGNHILGDLTLYKLGEDPRFQIRFLHEGRDGFGGHAAGEGFSLREENLGGTVETDGERVQSRTTLSYRETARGLQGQSASYSDLTGRDIRGETALEYRVSPFWSFLTRARVASSNNWLSGPVSDGYSELLIHPRLGLAFYPRWAELTFLGGYRYQDLTAGGTGLDPSQMLEAELAFSSDLPGGWALSGSGGVAWEPDRFLKYPFQLALSRDSGRVFNFSLQGGYLLSDEGLGTLWESYPFLKPVTTVGDPDVFQGLRGWEVLFNGRITPGTGFSFLGGVSWHLWENALLAGTVDPADGLYPFDRGELQNGEVNLGAEWELFPGLVLRGSWAGQVFLERDLLRPADTVAAEAVWYDSGDRGSVTARAEWGFYGADQVMFRNTALPRLGFSGYYRITQGVRVVLEGEDLLAPLLEEGRFLWDNYEDTGASVSLKIGISL